MTEAEWLDALPAFVLLAAVAVIVFRSACSSFAPQRRRAAVPV